MFVCQLQTATSHVSSSLVVLWRKIVW